MNKDRFTIIKDKIDKAFFFIRTKLDEREKRRGDPTQINNDIREKIG